MKSWFGETIQKIQMKSIFGNLIFLFSILYNNSRHGHFCSSLGPILIQNVRWASDEHQVSIRWASDEHQMPSDNANSTFLILESIHYWSHYIGFILWGFNFLESLYSRVRIWGFFKQRILLSIYFFFKLDFRYCEPKKCPNLSQI